MLRGGVVLMGDGTDPPPLSDAACLAWLAAIVDALGIFSVVAVGRLARPVALGDLPAWRCSCSTRSPARSSRRSRPVLRPGRWSAFARSSPVTIPRLAGMGPRPRRSPARSRICRAADLARSGARDWFCALMVSNRASLSLRPGIWGPARMPGHNPPGCDRRVVSGGGLGLVVAWPAGSAW